MPSRLRRAGLIFSAGVCWHHARERPERGGSEGRQSDARIERVDCWSSAAPEGKTTTVSAAFCSPETAAAAGAGAGVDVCTLVVRAYSNARTAPAAGGSSEWHTPQRRLGRRALGRRAVGHEAAQAGGTARTVGTVALLRRAGDRIQEAVLLGVCEGSPSHRDAALPGSPELGLGDEALGPVHLHPLPDLAPAEADLALLVQADGDERGSGSGEGDEEQL